MRVSSKKWFACGPVLILSAALVAPSVQAFDYGYKAENYFYTYQIDNVVDRATYENQKKYRDTYQKATTQKSSGESKTSGGDRYTHSDSVSQQVSEQMVQILRQDLQSRNQLTPQAQQDLNRLAGANLVGQVKQGLKSDGYEPDSVAVAMAYWVLINYGIARQEDLTQLKGQGLVQQLQAAVSDSEIASASHADKQKMAEMLYWMGSLQLAMYMEAQQQKNQQAISALMSDAQSALKNMGLDVNRIAQGSNGLELR